MQAANTDTEKAETEPDLAHIVNVDGARAVAVCARKLGAPIIHLSSSYVFDGSSARPYREDDSGRPVGRIRQDQGRRGGSRCGSAADHVTLRTSLVFSPFGRNSLTSFLKRAGQQDEVLVVADQLVTRRRIRPRGRNPDHRAQSDRGNVQPEYYGLFHLTSLGSATPAEFATALFAVSAQLGGPSAKVVPIKSDEYPSRVRRPLNSRLDCTKIATIHGVALPAWQPRLRTCVERVLSGSLIAPDRGHPAGCARSRRTRRIARGRGETGLRDSACGRTAIAPRDFTRMSLSRGTYQSLMPVRAPSDSLGR